MYSAESYVEFEIREVGVLLNPEQVCRPGSMLWRAVLSHWVNRYYVEFSQYIGQYLSWC